MVPYRHTRYIERPIRHRQKVNALYAVVSRIYKADSCNTHYKKKSGYVG